MTSHWWYVHINQKQKTFDLFPILADIFTYKPGSPCLSHQALHQLQFWPHQDHLDSLLVSSQNSQKDCCSNGQKSNSITWDFKTAQTVLNAESIAKDAPSVYATRSTHPDVDMPAVDVIGNEHFDNGQPETNNHEAEKEQDYVVDETNTEVGSRTLSLPYRSRHTNEKHKIRRHLFEKINPRTEEGSSSTGNWIPLC